MYRSKQSPDLFLESLNSAVDKHGIDTVITMATAHASQSDDFEFIEILSELHEVQLWAKLYKRNSGTTKIQGRDVYFSNIIKAAEFLESLVEIEELFTDAVEEIGFYNLMIDLMEGPSPTAQRMQPFALDNHQLRFSNKKGRLIASQGEYELVTFNIPQCSERLKEILLHAYMQDTSKIHLRKYIIVKLEDDLGL